MAEIGQISGPLLKSNLERNGVNLSIEDTLLYVDVNTNRIGINTNTPQHELEVIGTTTTDVLNAGTLNITNNTLKSTGEHFIITGDSPTCSIDVFKDTEFHNKLSVNEFVILQTTVNAPQNLIFDSWASNDGSNTVTIEGNFVVNGATTTINSTTVEFADKNIVIGSGTSDRSIADGAGITINLGTDGEATLTYQSVDDSFVFNKPLILDAGITVSGQSTTMNDLTLSGVIYGPPVLLIDPATHGDVTGLLSIDGDLIVNGPSTTLNDLSVGNITTTGYLRGPSTITIDPAAYESNTGLVDILGELTVNGTNTTVNDFVVNNITTSGRLTTGPTYEIQTLTGTEEPGLVTIGGNLTVTGAALSISDTIYGRSVLTLNPEPYESALGTVLINGELTVNGATTTINNLTSNNIVTTGSLTGPTLFAINAGDGEVGGEVEINGDLTVEGTTTTVNDFVANDAILNGDLSVPTDFSITPASSGTVLIAGDLEVTGSSVDIAGTLTGPSIFDIVPGEGGTVNIGGDLVVAGDDTTLNNLSVGNITTTGYIRGPGTLVLDPHIYDVELGLVEIEGSLNVKGADTTLHNVSAADITTTGTLYGPATFTIDPAAHGDNSGTVNILGDVAIGDALTVTNNASVGSLNTGTIVTTGQIQGPTTLIIDPATVGDNSGTVAISGDLAVNGSSTTLNDLAVTNITAAGYLRGPSTFTIDPAAYGDNTGTVVIAGNLQVNAGTVTAESSSIDNLTLTGRLDGPATFIIDPATHGDATGTVDVNGDLIVEGTTTTVNDIFTNNITATGYLRGPTTFTIDPATHGDNSGTVVIAGNLQIDGTTTTINSTVVSIDDKLVVVAAGSANNTAANGAGLQVDLGSNGTANFTYDSSADGFKVDKDFETLGELRVHGNTGQDSIVIKGSGSGASNFAVAVQPSPLTANRSVTLPNADVTLVAGTMVPTSRTISITNASGVTGASATTLENDINFNIGLDGQALALHNFAQTGMMVRTGTAAFAARQITVSGIGISIVNGNGIAGNPAITCNATHASTANAIVSRDVSGNFSANIISASLDGNATTASRLQTAITINGTSFNGSSSITITANTSNSLTRGSYLIGGNTSFNGSSASTWSVNASSSGTNNVVARDVSGNFSAGTITATLSGNASSATILQNTRTINGTGFNGSSNITITANTSNTLSPGSYISGLAFNGGTTTTWNVNGSTSGVNNLVARDASGNFSAGTITAALAASGHVIPTADNSFNLGSSTKHWNTIYGTTFTGTSTTAKYADLAENYIADKQYAAGTVLIFGGEYDVTLTDELGNRKVAGIVSESPAYLMDSELEGEFIVPLALQGKVPCNVIGIVEKGDMLVTSDYPGYAVVNNDPKVGTVIGKALEDKVDNVPGIVMVVVGRD